MKTIWMTGILALSLTAAAHANPQAAQISRILAQQAGFAHQQAHRLIAGGWGSSWQDQRAIRDLSLFVQQAQRLAQVAASCGNGNGGGWGNGNGGWNGGNNGGSPWNRGWGNGNGHGGGWGNGNGGWNGGNNGNAQLQQQFWATFQQGQEVERSLARAPRLQTIRGFWNAQVQGTLRQLRQVIGGGGWGNGRDGRREGIFDRLFN